MEIYLEQNLIELRGYQDDNAEIVSVLLYAIEEAGMAPPWYDKIQNNNGDKVLIPAREREPEENL